MVLKAAIAPSACHSGFHHHTADIARASASGRCRLSQVHQQRVQCPTRFRTSSLVCRAQDNGRDPNLEDYVEVKVESVRVAQGSSVVILKLLDEGGAMLPVHIGESESNSLMKEISHTRNQRPLTHDLAKNMIQKLGFKVTKIRITEIVSNTYYARIHLSSADGSQGEIDCDARPSDAINLAVRFGAPMYVSKRVAASAAQTPQPQTYSAQSESHADILRSIRDTVSSYEDPTVMYELQKELAVKEERFEDAQIFHSKINDEMTRNPELRLIVAMEAAASDGRLEEAARLRDEFHRQVQRKVTERK